MATLKETIAIHKTKPWIRDFKQVLIRPLRKVKAGWLGKKLRFRSSTGALTEWFVPTDEFWTIHAMASHPEDKASGLHQCDVKIHTSFLTKTGSNGEFEYGYQRKSDGALVIEKEADFAAECAWWKQKFSKVTACGPNCVECETGCSCEPTCPCHEGGACQH